MGAFASGDRPLPGSGLGGMGGGPTGAFFAMTGRGGAVRASRGWMTTWNASSAARLSASQVSPALMGPTVLPSTNVAEQVQSKFFAAAPFRRTFRPSNGSAMPRLPQYLPASTQGDSQLRPSTA